MSLELCRLCGNNKNLTSILDKGPEMLEKLKCAGIIIKSDDILPKLVCQQCDHTLDMSYLLRKQSEIMERRLQNEMQKKQAMEQQKAEVVNIEEDVQYISDEEFALVKDTSSDQNIGICRDMDKEEVSIIDTGGGDIAGDVKSVEPDILDTNSEATLVASETEGLDDVTVMTNAADSNDSYSFDVPGNLLKSEFIDDIVSSESYNTKDQISLKDTYKEDEEVDVGGNDEGAPHDFPHSDSSSNLLQPQECLSINMMSYPASPTPDNDTDYYPKSTTLPYTCITCGLDFPKKKEYKEHIALHGPDRYQCIQCLAAFPTRYRLIRHEAIHTNGAAYKCTECNRQYRMAYNLQRHILSCHSDKAKYQCHICRLNYTRSDVLKRHIAQVHGNTKKWHCKCCGMSFRSQYFLNVHKSQQVCNSTPPTNTVTIPPTKHPTESEYILLGTDNKYKCAVCNMKFASVWNCRTHLMIHKNIKPFPCSVCLKSFRTRYALINHERIHSNERPFQCDFCFKAFRQITHLKHHRMLHTKDNMVKCPECQAGFVTKWKLREHLRKEHCTMKAFKCAECPEEFFLKYDLKRHAKIVHLRSVCIADSDNEGVKNSIYIGEFTSDSEKSAHVGQSHEDEVHCNDMNIIQDNKQLPDPTEDVIDIVEDTDQEVDDDIQIVEDEHVPNNNVNSTDVSKDPEEVTTNASDHMDIDSGSCMFIFDDEEDSQITDNPNGNSKGPETNSRESILDSINLDSSNSCKSPPLAHTPSDAEYFDNIIEQEEEIHITEEKIEMYTTFYNVEDLTEAAS